MVELDRFDGLQYVELVEPGTVVAETDALSTSKNRNEIKLAYSSIRYTVFGRAHIVFYWDKTAGRLRSITTGD